VRIDSFSFGSITIDGEDYVHDLLLLPPRVISGWWRKEGHSVSVRDLAQVTAYHPEILVVGTGVPGMMRVPESTIRDMESTGIKMEVYPTQQACSRLNNLLEKEEKVAGALHLTC